MTRIAISQSNYLPWKGYFDMIASVDRFVLLDEVQYTRRDWRNRNKIKGPEGLRWLTVAVDAKGKYTQRIDETEIADPKWAERHWASIEQCYRGAAAFESHGPGIRELLESVAEEPRLSRVNRTLLEGMLRTLGIETSLAASSDFETIDGPSERLLSICRQAGATVYVSGPAAKQYLDVNLFEEQGIGVEWFSYGPYPEYPQLHPPFEHAVSVVDVVLNLGENARESVVLA